MITKRNEEWFFFLPDQGDDSDAESDGDLEKCRRASVDDLDKEEEEEERKKSKREIRQDMESRVSG